MARKPAQPKPKKPAVDAGEKKTYRVAVIRRVTMIEFVLVEAITAYDATDAAIAGAGRHLHSHCIEKKVGVVRPGVMVDKDADGGWETHVLMEAQRRIKA